MVFYDDNVPRATRLQQLVDSIANMQTDIETDSERLTKLTKDMKPAIDALLEEEGLDTLDKLIDKAGNVLSPKEMNTFRKLIDSVKKNPFDWDYKTFIAGLLLPLTLGKLATAQNVTAAGRLAVRASAVKAIADFLKMAKTRTPAEIAELAETIAEAADEGSAAIQEAAGADEEMDEGSAAIQEAAGADEEMDAAVVEEVGEAATAASRVATSLRVLGAFGFVVTIVVGVVQLYKGAEQKARLIEAIQKAQPARLAIAYFRAEASDITQQTELIKSYMKLLADKKDPKAAAGAKALHNEFITNISSANSYINWKSLEKKLEKEDAESKSFYDDDDLDMNRVISLARGSKKRANYDL